MKALNFWPGPVNNGKGVPLGHVTMETAVLGQLKHSGSQSATLLHVILMEATAVFSGPSTFRMEPSLWSHSGSVRQHYNPVVSELDGRVQVPVTLTS